MRKTRCIMLQGTSSHVGKSLLCTALCRIFHQDGYRTAPFKAQNMALNSTVTPDGGEIGRAQGVQAQAAGVSASVLMNPILLKPKQDMQSQVMVLGSPVADMSARDYRSNFLPGAVSIVQDCIERLKKQYEILVIEGAGSPAEVNLKDRDIVNMKTAELADSPVLLVADIDRGGVFASLIGTLELLDADERERVKGFIINKFRGDLELLKPGLDFLTEKTGIPILGVIPYLHDHGIDEEDSVSLSDHKLWGEANAPIQIAVLQLPRISNFTDIDAFIGLPDTRIRYIKKGEAIGKVDMLIIPGTKNSILDLLYLKDEGYEREILKLAREGAIIAGICGGYQMLGEKLLDPLGIEAGVGSLDGLGLLPVTTTFENQKSTHRVEGEIQEQEGFWESIQGQSVSGYEIHMGRSEVRQDAASLIVIKSRSSQPENVMDGAAAPGGRIFGTYLHGIFDNPNLMLALVNDLRQAKDLPALTSEDLPLYHKQHKYDILAQTVRESLNMNQLYQIMGL
ncbi:MAG: cobyric acid synthase [Syntrophomonadaceae bacterium]